MLGGLPNTNREVSTTDFTIYEHSKDRKVDKRVDIQCIRLL